MSANLQRVKRALISVSDKTNLDTFVRFLAGHRIEILASGGTYQYIKDLGVSVVEVSEYTQSPELFDGRVKTLHPKIHGGILAIRENATHQKQLLDHGISEIDLVVVSLYAFEEASRDASLSEEEIIEKIDIGGPSMIRSAAKNFSSVCVLVKPEQYAPFMQHFESNQEQTTLTFRKTLAKEAFTRTAAFDASIVAFFRKEDAILPETYPLSLKKAVALRYGENPHQQAGFYIEGQKNETLLTKILQGKQVSYNNIMDVHAGVNACADLTAKFSCVIIKHNNPCGIGISENSSEEAYARALQCDPVSAFGGIIVFNREVDDKLAEKTNKLFTEIVVAPSFTEGAKASYKKKVNLRLIELDVASAKSSFVHRDLRRALDGYLIQDVDRSVENLDQAQVVTKRSPSKEEFQALDLAWKAIKHVKSNAIVVSNAVQTLGIGAGQMNRLASVKLAAMNLPKNSVLALASDAFFPFRDNVDEISKHKITCIVQPGGSVKDQEVIDAADEYGIAMIFTGVRHFNH